VWGLHHAELRPRSLRYCTPESRKDCAEIRRDDGASYRFKLDTKRADTPSGGRWPMSALGQKQTFAPQNVMSALPPKATSNATYGMSAKGHKRTGALPPTQIIEGIQGRTNLLTDFGLWVDVLKLVDQRGIFGTQFFSQFVHSVKQRIEFLGIPRFVSLLHLVTEPGHLAINSSLGFVAADDLENLLRVRLGRLGWGRRLSLHTWRGGDHKSCKDDPQVSVMPLPTAVPDPKKVTK
jgi:hypothetical protein